MHLSEIVFKKKIIFYFFMLSLIAGGILSYVKISKLEDPEITVMMAKVVTIYPGASAHEVEMQVTNVLEDYISELADIESIKSQSAANVSIIDVELKMTVPQEEIAQRWEFMRRKVQNATSKLPIGCNPPTVMDDIGDVYGMFYAMTADGYTYREMADQAEYIKRNLLQVEGVRKVAIYGEQTVTVDIVMLPEKMAQMGILPLQLMSAIQDYNKTLYSGILRTGDNQIRVNVNQKVNSVEELGNILIKGLNKEVFKLSDFATIKVGYNDPFHNTMFMNNQKALGISLSMEPGENIVNVGKRVETRLAELQQTMPSGFKFDKVFFQPDEVNNAINDFIVNIIMSVAIVVFVLMLTMGLKSGIIIGSGLVLTILATFPFMYIAGGTMQRISLGAFIVAMGMLVDNAIVVIDGILVRMKTEGRKKSTFTTPAKRTAWPLLGATLIAIGAFLPAVLSKDAAGTYVQDLFIVLCISLFISWVLALTQVPLFSAIFIKKDKRLSNRNNTITKEDVFSGPIYKVVRKALVFFLKHKLATIAVSFGLLLVCVLNFKNVKQTFFPDFNYKQSYIEYKLPYGTSPLKVQSDLNEITSYLLGYKEVKMVITSQGMTPTRYCLVRPIGETIDNYGELIINYEDYKTMIKMKPVIEKYIRDNYPNAYFRIRKYNLSVKASHTVEVEFSGPDPAILRSLANQVEDIMRTCPYTDQPTICNDWSPMGKSLVANYNMAEARRNNTNRSDISYALLAATDGLPLGTFYEGETPISINLKIRNADGSRIEDMSDIPVWNMLPNIDAINKESIMNIIYGTKSVNDVKSDIVRSVPLSNLTNSLSVEHEELVVNRNNRKRTIQAQCEPIDGYAPELLRKTIMPAVEAIELPEGYTMKWVGEHDLQSTAIHNIFKYLPITILIIVFLLILLFNDIRRPLIVILCLPMSIIGIVPGLIITGQPYTFIAIIGTFGLIGMLTKNGIVLLDEFEKQIKEGRTRYHAIIDATISRTRPVIMASSTTILGMFPLFFDPMYRSMAVTVIFGLLIGTLITLIFIPILYAAFYKVKTH